MTEKSLKLKVGVQGGSGRIGSAITKILSPFYDVLSADAILNPPPDLFAVINAAPYYTSVPLANIVLRQDTHYLDLTEDVDTAAQLNILSKLTDRAACIPQCGLAPGVVSIVAGSMVRKYDKLRSLKLRVGGLPRHSTNALNYALTWSVEGLVNQYHNPATAIRDGKIVTVKALDDIEELLYEGGVYEAFNTSGGVGTLCSTFPDAENIDYKTIRYPGHAALMKFLIRDLGIGRPALKEILERAIPVTDQDVVLISVTSTGFKNDVLSQATYAKHMFGVPGRAALQTTTAASICAVLDMLADGTLKCTGFVKQEEIPLEAFVKNRFGRVFA